MPPPPKGSYAAHKPTRLEQQAARLRTDIAKQITLLEKSRDRARLLVGKIIFAP
jgi:hypothetical protein